MPEIHMKTTLIAVTGLSPAIVTETLWALSRLKPAVYPDSVVFVTTCTGSKKIEEQLFTKKIEWNGLTVWDALRAKIKAPEGTLIAQPPAIITKNNPMSGRAEMLDDIRTPEENAAAAEFIFGRVWDVVRDSNQRLIASVAGGRKTMGALLHSAVSLIGRESDLLTHILVDSPFDTLPGFFFPGQPGGELADRSGKLYSPSKAKPILADVPCVPLRNRVKELNDLPGSFMDLRNRLADALTRDTQREVPIRIDIEKKCFFVDGKSYKANVLQLAVLEFILRAHLKKHTFVDPTGKIPTQNVAADAFLKWAASHIDHFPGIKLDKDRGVRIITQPLSEIRKKLANAPWKPAERSFIQAPFRLEPS